MVVFMTMMISATAMTSVIISMIVVMIGVSPANYHVKRCAMVVPMTMMQGATAMTSVSISTIVVVITWSPA